MPPTVGFPQKKVFEHKLSFARRKRTRAYCERYPRIDAVRQSSTSNHLKERPAMRTDEIDLCDLDEEVVLALGCRQRRGAAGMTLT
jgi:hypothetical protein